MSYSNSEEKGNWRSYKQEKKQGEKQELNKQKNDKNQKCQENDKSRKMYLLLAEDFCYDYI